MTNFYGLDLLKSVVVISCVCRIHDEFKTRICNGGTMMYFVDNLNEKALDLNA